jgi:biotin synthase-related radical SAM superfamily protein
MASVALVNDIRELTGEFGVLGRKRLELQGRGVTIPKELLDELETNWNAPHVKNGRIVLGLENPDNNGKLTTVLVVNGKFTAKSPYHMVKNGSNYEIWENGRKYTDIVLLPHPKFYDKFTSDGIPMYKIAVIGEPEHLRSVINQSCAYQQAGKACKFCAIEGWWAYYPSKTPTQIAETTEAAVNEGQANHLTLSTGSRFTTDKGLKEIVETSKIVQARTDVTMTLNFEPITDYGLLESLLQESKEAGGVKTIICNIECFDEALREEVMPIKGRNSVEMYLKTWDKCVEIFGENEVYTMVIGGLGEDDESILRGVEMAASHGVVTALVAHIPMIGAAFEDMEPPTTERMLRLYEEIILIHDKYGLQLYGGTGGRFTSLKGM